MQNIFSTYIVYKNKIMIRTAVILMFVISSCKTKQDDPILIEALTNSLEVSSKLISGSTALTLEVLQNRTMKPEYQERAVVWEPKAVKVKRQTEALILFIDTLRKATNELQKETKSTVADTARGRLLFERLAEYKRNILSIDSQLNDVLDRDGYLFRDFRNSSPAKFQSFYFEGSKKTRYTHFTMLANQIRVTENRAVNFCYENTGSLDGYGFYSTFTAIIGQSTAITSPGKEIEIVAGIGSFSRAAIPTVWIDGKKVPLADDGPARLTFKAPSKPGNYKSKVVIIFTDQEGIKQEISKTLEFTVAAPAS